MMEELKKISSVREKMEKKRGESIDDESGIRFVRVKENMVKMWEEKLKGYEIEEKGLRVMLDEDVVERKK